MKEREELKNFVSVCKGYTEKSETLTEEQKTSFTEELKKIPLLSLKIITHLKETAEKLGGTLEDKEKESDDSSSEGEFLLLEDSGLIQDLEYYGQTCLDLLDRIYKLDEKQLILNLTLLDSTLKALYDISIYIAYTSVKVHEEQTRKNREFLPLDFNELALEKVISEHKVELKKSLSEIANSEKLDFNYCLKNLMVRGRKMMKKLYFLQGSASTHLKFLRKFPWALDFAGKKTLLSSLPSRGYINLVIKRENLLEESMDALNKEISVAQLRVQFVDEPGADAGGVRKEWLTITAGALFDVHAMKLFNYAHNKITIYPNAHAILTPKVLRYFKLVGKILGLAIYNSIPIDVNFSEHFLKLLLNIQPKIEDLHDVDPHWANSLTWMQENSVTGILDQNLDYYLDIEEKRYSQEVVKGGKNMELTDENKSDFIHNLLMCKLYREAKDPIDCIKQELYKIIPANYLQIFTPAELSILISGESTIDVKELIKHLKEGYSKASSVYKWFVEIVNEYDQAQLSNFMFFVTGASRVPFGGFAKHPIRFTRGHMSETQLPISHTCFLQIEVPEYRSKESFAEKLMYAITYGKEGFGFV